MDIHYTRCDTAAQVETIAARNPHSVHTHTAYAASVTLPGATYWWVAS